MFYLCNDPVDIINLKLSNIENSGDNIKIIEWDNFLFGSLYSRNIKEEIELLYYSKIQNNLIKDNKEIYSKNFVKKWGLTDVFTMKFDELSGGWRKYALIAVQVESINENYDIIAINIQNQLDNIRVNKIISNLKSINVNKMLFIEDNKKMLISKLNFDIDKISFDDWCSL